MSLSQKPSNEKMILAHGVAAYYLWVNFMNRLSEEGVISARDIRDTIRESLHDIRSPRQKTAPVYYKVDTEMQSGAEILLAELGTFFAEDAASEYAPVIDEENPLDDDSVED